MHRNLFAAQMAQYTTPTITGKNNLVIKDGIKCYLPELKIAGNTFQKTYAGKNLINSFILVPSSSSNAITQSVNNDGSISINGMSTGTANTVFLSATLNQLCLQVEKTYTIAIKALEGEIITGGIGIYIYKDKSYFASSGWINNTNTVFSMGTMTIKEENEYIVKIAIKTATKNEDGNVFDFRNLKLQLMLYEDKYSVETFPEYEPYIPLSPDYPTDIVNAGDNDIEVKVRGANILNIPAFKLSYSANNYGWQTNLNGDSITISAESATTRSIAFLTDGKQVITAGKYKFSVDKPLPFRVRLQNSNFLIGEGKTEVIVNYTGADFVNKAIALDAMPVAGKPWTVESITFKLMLQKIDNVTSIDEYEPYVEPQKITIPLSAVKENGEVVDLAFRYAGKYSNTKDWYDYLKVDTVNKTVKYYQNTNIYICDSNTIVKLSSEYNDYRRFYIDNYSMNMKINTSEGRGYCSHFSTSPWFPTKEGALYGAVNMKIYLMLDKNKSYAQDVGTVQAWMVDEYNKGTPITFITPYKETVHDITNTSLGQELLSLIQNNGTTVIEASNTINLSQTLTAKYLKHA